MKVSFALFIASASGALDVDAIPEFVQSSTEQIVCGDLVRSTQPYYCFGSEYQDCSCWQETCGLCLPQCCFKNKGNCPNNIDNAQCNVGEGPPPTTPTPPNPYSNNRGNGGPSYCYFEPNYGCYPNTGGRPGCCHDDYGAYCPYVQPGCHQSQPTGEDYCTYGFDYQCYPGYGKPSCCFENGGQECPYEQPPCQGSRPSRMGQNYCNYSFDYSCYPFWGKPSCCFQGNGQFCPPQPESCAPTTTEPPPGPGPNPRPPPPGNDKKFLRFKAMKGSES